MFMTQPPAGFQTGFSGTAHATLTGTTETSIMPTGVGAKTIRANWLKPGRTARLIMRGVVSTGLVPGTATFKVKLGGNIIASGSASALLGSLNESGFVLSQTIACWTTGTAGTIAVAGEARYSTGLTGTKGTVELNSATPVAVNTTIDLPIDVTVTWGLTGNNIKVITCTLELLEQ